MPKKFTTQIESTVPNGTAPLIVASQTLVNNLNAQYLNGVLGSGYVTASAPTLAGLVTITGNDNSLYLSGSPTSTPTSTKGLLQIGTLGFQDKNILANFQHSVNDYAQVVFQNTSSGTSASMDIVINNDTGGASANYADLGINSSTQTGGGVWDDPNGTYLYANGGSLTVGTQGTQALRFATGNTLRASIDSNGTFTIPTSSSGTVNALTLSGTPSGVAVSRGMLQVGTTLPSGNADSNILASFVSNVNAYTQIIIQNTNASGSASADVVVANDSSTPSTIYGDFGINSSSYTGTGAFNTPNDVYVYAVGTDIVFGTRSANNALIATNDVTRLTIADASSTFTNRIVAFTASNTTAAPLTLPHLSAGTAPATLNNGDIWTTTAGLFAYINGATVGPFNAGGTVSLSGNNSWTGTNTFSQPIISTFQNTASLGAIAVTSAQRTQTSARGQIHIGPDLPSADTTLGYVGVSSAATYFQNILQNTSTDVAASVDIVIYNNATSNGGNTLYGDIGLNSSTYTGGGVWGDPSGMYIYMNTGSLSIGTDTANNFRIATNSTERVLFNATGGITFASGTTVSTESSTLLSTTLNTTATSTTSTNSNAITIRTGNATGTTSSSGAITIDSGTGTTAAGIISIGTTNSPTVNIGRITGTGGTVVAYPADATTTTGTTSAGYMGMPQKVDPGAAYSLIASDAGKHIYYTTGTNTLTIPANGTGVAFPVGTTIVIANASATALTIQITTDTLRLAGTANTGQRSLAQYGIATLIKVASNVWWISGNGLA